MSRRKRSCSTRFSLFSFQDIITCVMGIMLLLTLLICLQISDTPARSSSDVKARSSELQTSVSQLQKELAELDTRVRANSKVLQSGGLSNVQLLQEKQQSASSARTAAEQELFALLQQSQEAGQSLTDVKTSVGEQQKLSTEEIKRLIEVTRRQQQTLNDMKNGKRIVYNRYIGGAETCWIVEVSSDTDVKAAPIGKPQVPLSFSTVDQVLTWTRERHQEGAEFLVLFKPAATNAIDRIPGTLREEGILHGYDVLGQDQTALDPQTGAEPL